MKTKLERFFFGIILAPVAPLAGMMLAWWVSYLFLPEKWIPLGSLAGLCAGVAVDLFFLKGLVFRACQLKIVLWAAVYLFYTIGVFGFFMGVPVFNALLSVPAGFVVAAKLTHIKAGGKNIEQSARKTAWFTTGVVFFICAASASIALLSRSTASDLRGMLGLGFQVTEGMILGLILVGGAGLLAVNWTLAWGSTRLAYKFLGSEG